MSNQQTRTTARLREMILNGAFAPGERITESALASALGVSRTPVRLSLSVLEREGLVSSEPNRGFRVEAYSIGDISDAIDVRGTLEGMAARLVAEDGLAPHTAAALEDCLEIGERIIAKRAITPGDASDFGEMNGRFHKTIIEACNNKALENGLDLTHKMPFVEPAVIAIHDTIDGQQQMMVAQHQHRLIFDALENGEGARAEALMREHANVSKQALNVIGASIESGEHSAPPSLRLVTS
ncbi:MAG: FCD domain-containing protein [Alphaproteobacteria bacterium]|nr:FCD domain-containing protein [Alphaproteobacteria bacterium]